MTLHSEAVALFVFLNIKDNNIQGWFSDNGFIMVTNSKTVTFRAKQEISLNRFEENLKVISLHDAV